MKTLKFINNESEYTIVIFVYDDIIAIVRYGNENKAYVSYVSLFSQKEVDYLRHKFEVDKILKEVNEYCYENGITLYSY
jgi:uncharacterized protein YerC